MRHISIGLIGGSFAHFPILDEDAKRLIEKGILYECGETEGEHADHDLHLDPIKGEHGLWESEEILKAIGNAHKEWESDHVQPVKNFDMSAVVTASQIEAMTPDAWEKRKAYYFRNLALNIATSALGNEMIEKVETTDDKGNVTLRAIMSIVPPTKRSIFSSYARLYVIALLDSMKGVSDQRKEEAIALIEMLK